MKPITLAGLGCGSRTTTYMQLASQFPDQYRIVAAADPIPWKVQRIARFSKNPDFRAFPTGAQLLAQDRLADVLIIGTQDDYHIEPCMAAIAKGYDVLLEKPIGDDVRDILKLEKTARDLGRRVIICHVLRYTPFYERIKQIVDSGELGRIITLHASEGVGTFHQAHSFVRGHWAVTDKSNPMIVAKSCHDTDIIAWLLNSPCKSVSSFGRLTHFTHENKPANAPQFCVEGCPVETTCQYNARRYLTDQRAWLPYVYNGGEQATDADIEQWLKTAPWGRCVYQCDNTAVDHQILNMDFAGGATASFTMSAFDSGRNIELWGTEAVLHAGAYTKKNFGCDIILTDHRHHISRQIKLEPKPGGYISHGGGDAGLIESLYNELTLPPDQMRSSLHASVESHLIGFAAEESRLTGKTVDLADFRKRHGSE